MAVVPEDAAGFTGEAESWPDAALAEPIAVPSEDVAGLAIGTAERRKPDAGSAALTLEEAAAPVAAVPEDTTGLAEGTSDRPDLFCDAGKFVA